MTLKNGAKAGLAAASGLVVLILTILVVVLILLPLLMVIGWNLGWVGFEDTVVTLLVWIIAFVVLVEV